MQEGGRAVVDRHNDGRDIVEDVDGGQEAT